MDGAEPSAPDPMEDAANSGDEPGLEDNGLEAAIPDDGGEFPAGDDTPFDGAADGVASFQDGAPGESPIPDGLSPGDGDADLAASPDGTATEGDEADYDAFLKEMRKGDIPGENADNRCSQKVHQILRLRVQNGSGGARWGYIPRMIPDRDRLKRKVNEIAADIKKIPKNYSREQIIGEINRINSKIRGLIQYNQCCTWVSVAMDEHSRRLSLIAKRRLKQYKGKWIPASQVQNLLRVHQQYRQKIPSIKYRDIYIGFTALNFCKWECALVKSQAETPYTETGRQINFRRTKKKRINARLDEMYTERSAEIIAHRKWGRLNNFEFVMNRAYRDKLKCKVCGGWLIDCTPWAHRINPHLPLNKVNRVNNLVSLHKKCFDAVNYPSQDISQFDVKVQKKIIGYREKLVSSHTRNK